MLNLKELETKYKISPEQAELLEYQIEHNKCMNETEIVANVIQLVMLTKSLEKLGFEPSIHGCEQLVRCIPTTIRKGYPDSDVQTAILYTKDLCCIP